MQALRPVFHRIPGDWASQPIAMAIKPSAIVRMRNPKKLGSDYFCMLDKLQAINARGDAGGAETVIDIHDGDVGGAGV